MLRVSVRADPAGAWLENMLTHAVELAQTASPGSEAVAGRLAEALFAEALRRYVLQLPPGRTGWLAAAADPAVGRALARLHQQPAQAWTLDALAQEAGLSGEVEHQLFGALQAKDSSAVAVLTAGLPIVLRDAFAALSQLYGDRSVLAPPPPR